MNCSTQHHDRTEVRTVRIPGSTDHAGQHLISITLRWVCPTCGRPRGQLRPATSYDGSRRLACDGWTNSCGHIDYYADVRREPRSWPLDRRASATTPTG